MATAPHAMVVPTPVRIDARGRRGADLPIFAIAPRSRKGLHGAVTEACVRGSIAVVSIVTGDHPSATPSRGPNPRMRPTRDRALLVTSIVGSVALAGCLAACGKQALEPSTASAGATPPLDVVVGDPSPARPLPLEPTAVPAPEPRASVTPAASEPDAEPEALPKSWTGPIVPGLSFADALRKARGARDAFSHLTPPAASAKEPVMKVWFGQAQSLVDQASRMYAAAFHAPDGVREGRIDAIAEAAELDMTMARNLDDAGLGALPAAWRSDPAVATTFEDIAVGPTRRWRDEARVLARQCIDTARDTGVATDAARRCALLRTGAPLKIAKRTAGADAGAPCACAAGDPLCSASLGGWCGSGASR